MNLVYEYIGLGTYSTPISATLHFSLDKSDKSFLNCRRVSI